MNLRKTLIQGAILSLALAFYTVVFQPMYNAWLETIGRNVGIGETALGFFLVFLISWFVTNVLTRKTEGSP